MTYFRLSPGPILDRASELPRSHILRLSDKWLEQFLLMPLWSHNTAKLGLFAPYCRLVRPEIERIRIYQTVSLERLSGRSEGALDWGSEDRKDGARSNYWPLLTAKEAQLRSLQLFTRQSLYELR